MLKNHFTLTKKNFLIGETMKKDLIVSIAVIALAWSSPLCAFWKTKTAPQNDCNVCEFDTTFNTGFNLSALGGVNWAHTTVAFGHVEFDPGYLFGGSAGYRWNMGLEVEAEVIYRRNGLENVSLSGEKFKSKGHLRKMSYMGNLKYYLPPRWYIAPYFGAGAGYANQKLFIDKIGGLSINSNQKKEGFAWQVLAGITCYLCRHLDLDIDYHYLQLKGSTHDNSLSLALTGSF